MRRLPYPMVVKFTNYEIIQMTIEKSAPAYVKEHDCKFNYKCFRCDNEECRSFIAQDLGIIPDGQKI